MDKMKIMGFHQPPSTIIFDNTPYPNDTPPNFTSYTSKDSVQN